jgi:hypothetical protein
MYDQIAPRAHEPTKRGSANIYECGPGRSFADAKQGMTRYNEPTNVLEDSVKRYQYQPKASSSAFIVRDVIIAGDLVCGQFLASRFLHTR